MENETDPPAVLENETDPPAPLEKQTDPLAQFGLDAIDLRWTLKDIAAERSLMVNKQHLEQLIELGLVEMREDVPPSPLPGRTRPGRINGSGTLKPLWKPPKSH
jgi:hypothetical protein